MSDSRPLGVVLVVVGLAGLLVSALANPLGIGEDEVFGWLQITGVVVGAIVALVGAALATEWIPLAPRRRSAGPPTTG